MINLDTHIVLAVLAGALRRAEEEAMRDEAYGISGVVLWEVVRLHRDGRSKVALEEPAFQRFLRDATIWPIDYQVATALRRLDFRSDPADEIIAATSIAHGVPLLTRDSRILGSKVVPFAVRD